MVLYEANSVHLRPRNIILCSLLFLLPIVLAIYLLSPNELMMVGGAIAVLPLVPRALNFGWLVHLKQSWLLWPAFAFLIPITSGNKVAGPLSQSDLILGLLILLWYRDNRRNAQDLILGTKNITELRRHPLFRSLLAYIGVMIFTIVLATDFGEAISETIKWVQVLIIIWLARQMLTREQAYWVMIALVAAGVTQAIYGLYQFVNRIGPPWFLILDNRFMRASGSFGQPNPFGGYLGLCLPVMVSLSFWSWVNYLKTSNEIFRDRWQRRDPQLLWLLLSVTATLLTSAALFASWSRGGWLGAVVAITIVILLYRNILPDILSTMRSNRITEIVRNFVLIPFAGLLALYSFRPDLIPEAISERLQDIPTYLGLNSVFNIQLSATNWAVMERMAHWIAAIRMWASSPIFGVGPGNYAAVYPEVRMPMWHDPLGHAHNIYLNVMAETGIVGLVIYLALWISIIRWALRQLREESPTSWRAALLIGVLGVIGHLSTHNFFDNLFVQGMYLHIGLWLAVLTVDS